MNQQEILKKIGGIIAELNDQYTYLYTAESGFNDLELELFMANAHFLTDHIGIFQKINHQPATAALPVVKPVLQIAEAPQQLTIPDYFDEQDLSIVTEKVPFFESNASTIELPLEEVQPPQKTIILPETISAQASEIEHKDVTMPEEMPETKPVENLKTDASFTDQKLATQPDLEEDSFGLKNDYADEQATRPETISLNIEPEATSAFSISSGSDTKTTAALGVQTLNERIAAQKGLDQPKIERDLQPKTIQDLQTMISLNDKLLFVKELFNGYNLAYTEAVNILNRYNNFDQAKNFLDVNYTVKNNWKDKPITTEKFLGLLQKKFGTA